MSKAGKWIILAVIAIVALSPLGEIFDKTDELSQDCSDFVLYSICVFSFLGFLVRRGSAIVARLASSSRIKVLSAMQRPLLEQKHDHVSPEARHLFLTFCDLRI